MTDLPPKSLLRPSKVAKLLDVPLSTIYYWITIGKLEAIKLPGNNLRISRQVIEELQSHTTLT
jgi:excisionase family DNA binding protein